MYSRADTNENMEVEDYVNKTLTEDKYEDEGEDTFKAVDSKFNYVSYIFEGHRFLNIAVMCYPVIIIGWRLAPVV